MKKLNCIQKRSLLYGPKTSADELIRLGGEALAEGALADALAYFLRADHREGLEKIRDLALDEGDAFLLAQIVRNGARVPVTPEHWRKAAETAERAGKLRFAVQAWRAAGDEAAAARIEADFEGRPPTLPSEPTPDGSDE